MILMWSFVPLYQPFTVQLNLNSVLYNVFQIKFAWCFGYIAHCGHIYVPKILQVLYLLYDIVAINMIMKMVNIVFPFILSISLVD